jgi:hypothetical protein
MRQGSSGGIIRSVKKISKHGGISMSLSNLIRWAGLLAVVGGLLNIIIDLNVVLGFGQESAELLPFVSLPFLARFVLVFAMDVLLLLGLVGLYASASEATGILGLVGFLTAFVGWEWVFIAGGWESQIPYGVCCLST